MTLSGFKARNHPQQKRNPKVDDRATTPEDYEVFDRRFGFTLDAAASHHNTKVPNNYFTMADDGLSQEWHGRVWCNPPYSNIEAWVSKAWLERGAGRAELVVMLLPANRTEQGWWQRQVEPYRGWDDFKVEFLAGRMRFIAHDDDQIRPNSRPPFGNCLLIWGDDATA